MASLPHFRLELPDGSVFVADTGLDYTFGQQWFWLFDGASNALAIFEQFSQGSGDGGLKQQLFAGTGAGVHTITVEFNQYTGSTSQWGDSNASDSPRSKLQELNHALNTVRISSDDVAILEVGEYSSAGKFNPLPVVVVESTLRLNTQEQSSSFDGSIQFAESADLNQAIHRTKRGQ